MLTLSPDIHALLMSVDTVDGRKKENGNHQQQQSGWVTVSEMKKCLQLSSSCSSRPLIECW